MVRNDGPRHRVFIVMSVGVSWTLTLWMLVGAAQPDSERCPGGIVEIGDLSHTVRAHCGDPDFEVVLPRVVIVGNEDGETVRRTTVEQWTFNRGTDDFVRTYTLENGRLRSIRRGARGVARIAGERRECARDLVKRGTPSGEVFIRCGAPDTKHRAITQQRVCRQYRDESKQDCVHYETVQHIEERWTYDFGTSRFLGTLVFVDGQLATLEEDHERGFRPSAPGP